MNRRSFLVAPLAASAANTAKAAAVIPQLPQIPQDALVVDAAQTLTPNVFTLFAKAAMQAREVYGVQDLLMAPIALSAILSFASAHAGIQIGMPINGVNKVLTGWGEFRARHDNSGLLPEGVSAIAYDERGVTAVLKNVTDYAEIHRMCPQCERAQCERAQRGRDMERLTEQFYGNIAISPSRRPVWRSI